MCEKWISTKEDTAWKLRPTILTQGSGRKSMCQYSLSATSVSFSPYGLVPMSNTVSKKVGTFTAKFCCGTFTVFESTNEAA